MVRQCMPFGVLVLFLAFPTSTRAQSAEPRNFPYIELAGKVEEFTYRHDWRSYYWREDFTMLVRDGEGKLHRVISREPTPWTDYRLGTTFTGLPVDWTRQPQVRIIGVRAVDRIPAEFYDLKLDAEKTVTAFIVRVDTAMGQREPVWKDFYVNNWFHKWGAEPDVKMLPHYANDDPNYTVYGYLGSIAAPVDAESKKLLEKFPDGYIYHGRVVKAKNDVGYELHIIHLLGREKKPPQDYKVFCGDPRELIRLDGNAPPEAKKK
jgi:hypothetical protein